MHKINLSARLAAILETDRALGATVAHWLSTFEDVLSQSRMPFFPDYTDHGHQHLSDVLATADALIPECSAPFLSSADIAALSLGVLLHDIGMHLTRDGFVALVQNRSGLQPVAEMNDQPWSTLWDRYIGEASRFSGRQNIALYGTSEPVVAPDLSLPDWTEKQYYMAGEFLRRNHAALAHQIGLYGFPGSTLLPLPPTDHHLANIAGLIARSHGLPLRPAMDYLDRHYGDRLAPFQIHAVYLMVILRIADYLQLHPSRAPAFRPRIQHLRSPVSKRQWDKHAAVGYISFDHVDTDALYAYVEPPDVECYLAMRETLTDIQQELDGCWAVLGECYSRHSDLSSLQISKRRIRSNLDDPSSRPRFPYVPARAAFGAAESDLLKLVIGPLYENKPEIGIRELVQNSVDAVRERWAYCARRGDSPPDVTAHVTVNLRIESGNTTLEISDCGIGMTEEVVRHYFLRAAASFRYSDAWRREFVDLAGHATVLRSGRFGIGVLAAFLLGDELYVSTRHISEDIGIEFSATLETDPIELRYVRRPVGTTVRVRVPDVIGRKLVARGGEEWDWYCLSFPSVVRIIQDGAEVTHPLNNTYRLPDLGDLPNVAWRLAVVDDGMRIGWSYSEGPAVVCNGLLVQHRSVGKSLVDDRAVHISCPRLLVFDRDGRLPLNLQRTSLGDAATDLFDPIAEDIAYNFLACASVVLPERPMSGGSPVLAQKSGLERPQVRFCGPDDFEYSPWAYMKKGAVILDPYLLSAAGIRKIVLIRQPRHRVDTLPARLFGFDDIVVPTEFMGDLADDTAVVGLYAPESSPYYSRFLAGQQEQLRGSPFEGFEVKGARVCSSRHHSFFAETVNTPTTVQIKPGWLETFGLCEVSETDYQKLVIGYIREDPNICGTLTVELYVESRESARASVIGRVLEKCAQSIFIPYDLESRNRWFSGAGDRFLLYRSTWSQALASTDPPSVARPGESATQYFG